MRNYKNIIKKTLVYLCTVLLLFVGIYYFFDNFADNMTVTVKMQQTETNPVYLIYQTDIYDNKNISIKQDVQSTENYETVEFKVPLNYLYGLSITFNSTTINNVSIEEISATTLFSKRTFKDFNNMNFDVDPENKSTTLTIASDYVFTIFQLTTKVKLISLLLSIVIAFICRNQIDKLSNFSIVGNVNFKVTLFVCALFIIYITNLITLKEKKSYLVPYKISDKPTITQYSDIFDKSFMSNSEAYLKKKFLYNDFLIEDYYSFNRALLKNQIGNKYFTDFDDSVFIIEKQTFNQSILDSNLNKLHKLNDMLSERNIPHYEFIVPNKELLHPELCPNYLDNHSKQIKDYFIDGLSDTNINVYDLTDFVYQNSIDKDSPTHFRLDHHWTTETMFDSYKYILNTIKNDVSGDYTDISFEREVFTDTFSGSLGKSFGYGYRYLQEKDNFTLIYPSNSYDITLRPISIPNTRSGNFYNILDTYRLFDIVNYADVYQTYTASSTNAVLTNNSIENDSTVVIFGDSYSQPVAHFLSLHFKTVIQIDQRRFESDGQSLEYLSEYIDDIDLVISLQYVGSLQEKRLFNYFTE